MTNTNTNQKPLVTTWDAVSADPFATYETVRIPSAALRSGMVLVDDTLGTAAGQLVRRIGNLRGGIVAWAYRDADTSVLRTATFPVTLASAIEVAAR